MSTNILVTGATGTQGTAIIQALLKHPTRPTIHALVRDPNSSTSQHLASLSSTIKLYKGVFDDISSLQAAAHSCTAAFILTSSSFTDPDLELTQFNNIISALTSTPTIKRVVYSTSAMISNPSDPTTFAPGTAPSKGDFRHHYYANKFANEEHLIKIASEKGWNYTILQPATFLSNFLPPMSMRMYPRLASEKKIITAFPRKGRGSVQSYVSADDIGVFAAASLDPDGVGGGVYDRLRDKRVKIGSVDLTVGEVVESLNGKLEEWGKEERVELENLGREEAEGRRGKDLILDSQLFLTDNPVVVDVDGCRGVGLELLRGGVEGYWEREKERVLEAVGLK